MSITVVNVVDLQNGHSKIRAADWRSPLIRRLLGTDKYSDGNSTVIVSHRQNCSPETVMTFSFCWKGMRSDFNQCVNTYQEPVITEFATLGVACACVQHCAKTEITEVTRRGEKADYWLGKKEMLLEVSGQQSGDLHALHEEKRKQLLGNPFGVGGYVCVANYTDAAVVFWHYSYGSS